MAAFAGTGAHTLTLQTGSVLNGAVEGSAASGATNALILQGTGTDNNNFTNFNTLTVQATGTWTLGGTSAFGTGEVQTGTLSNTGSLATLHPAAVPPMLRRSASRGASLKDVASGGMARGPLGGGLDPIYAVRVGTDVADSLTLAGKQPVLMQREDRVETRLRLRGKLDFERDHARWSAADQIRAMP